MTVWKSGGARATWRYRFYLAGQKYQGNTGQLRREDAEEWEDNERRKVSRQRGGLTILPEHAPRFTDWAAVYVKALRQQGRVRRIERVEDLLRVVLRFWGKKPTGKNPKNPILPTEPYHNLTLADPLRDPDWIEKFEDWMRARRVRAAGGTWRPLSTQQRLHYLSVMSRMYRFAALPRFRKQTGIGPRDNPFLGLERQKPSPRLVTVTPAELQRWLAHTPKHAQLAIAIAALAPKLRKANILALTWSQIDPGFRFITVAEHKTMGQTQLPLVVPISRSLRRLLETVRKTSVSAHVITYRGQPVKDVRHAIQAGAELAGLTYGRDVGGVTFHTIRHMAATLLAEVPGLTEAQRSATMGQDIQTTQLYTHLRPLTQAPVVNALAGQLQIDQVLTQAFGIPPETKPEVPRRSRRKAPSEQRPRPQAASRARKRRLRQ